MLEVIILEQDLEEFLGDSPEGRLDLAFIQRAVAEVVYSAHEPRRREAYEDLCAFFEQEVKLITGQLNTAEYVLIGWDDTYVLAFARDAYSLQEETPPSPFELVRWGLPIDGEEFYREANA